MQKFKKYLLCLFACCLAFVCAFGAACSEDSSDGDSTGNGSSSSESTSSNSSSSASTSSESSSSESSSSESSSSDSTGDDSDDDDYTLTSTTVYFVGDSTVCEFSDAYYLPRYGYGTQFSNYINSSYVTVTNLALSGRSSRSYILEDEYQTLKTSLKDGDYLIIGFGHNDEKTETNTDHRYTSPETDAVNTEGSFQYYLYKYYVEMAINRGATPILCTPIVRYSSSADYTGSTAHITSNGDYAACIRDLAEDYNITLVDLTSVTKTLYTDLEEDAQWFHAHTSAKISDDSSARTINVKDSETNETVNVVPTGRDDTHLNMYGAKEVAYQIAKSLRTDRKTCALGYYVNSNIAEPDEDDFEAAFNSSYEYKSYDAFDASDDVSDIWSLSTSGWYGTVFGDTGTEVKNFTSYYTISDDTSAGTITVGSLAADKGKITSTEGIAMAFMQLAYNQNFEMTVTATVTKAAATDTSNTTATAQSGFGLMLRDDIYIDTYDKSILSNYIAAGMYASSSATNIIYSRVDATLTNSGKKASSVYKVGDTATLTFVRQGQTYSCTVVYGGTTYTYSSFDDFDLVTIDGDYIYLGLYATRGTVVTFSDITYTATGTAEQA